MELLTRDNVKELIEKQARWCVSIYIPTHAAGKEIHQDSIRLGNLLKEAAQRLASGGYRSPDIQKMLEPAQKLLKDAIFWRYQGDGLALNTSSRCIARRVHISIFLNRESRGVRRQ